MTAVAVVTPSSGSNSATTPFVEAVGLPWVVGADTGVLLSSSHAAPWPSCALLFAASSRLPRSGSTGLRSKPSGAGFPAGERVCPGATTEDRPAVAAGGPRPPARGGPPARGDGGGQGAPAPL